MPSSKEYLNYVLCQLSGLEEVTYRAMMGEYVLYYKDKVIGGIYDNRLLVKPVQSAVNFIDNVQYEIPYPGAKQMLLVDNLDNKTYLEELFCAMYPELPQKTVRKKK